MAIKDFSLSIVIPVFNEEGNLEELQRRIVSVMAELENVYEVIYVNDGSSDESATILDKLAAEDEHVKVLHFMRNYGQTAAIAAGVDHASGDAVCFMDADLQNDPADIPDMLEKLDEGHGVVSGWRKNRKDGFMLRKLPSIIANRMISAATGVKLHDYGCTLKIYQEVSSRLPPVRRDASFSARLRAPGRCQHSRNARAAPSADPWKVKVRS
jgi:glycosyltransferase involved in cell wall biosynthesis